MRYLLLAVALSLTLAGCGSGEEPAPKASEPASRTLADGTVTTAQQEAFLRAVEPSLSEQLAGNPVKVLSEAESLCTVYVDPDDRQSQAQAVGVWTGIGWNETESWAIARAAAEHLCS